MAYPIYFIAIVGLLQLTSEGNAARILIVPVPSGSHIMTAHQVQSIVFSLVQAILT